MRVLLAMTLATLTATFALAQSSSVAVTAAQGDAAAGSRAFVDYGCYFCHGTVGQGSLPRVGPRVARTARSLESFRTYLRQPAGRMSSYPAPVIADETIADIYAYLRSVPGPPQPLPALLQQLRKR